MRAACSTRSSVGLAPSSTRWSARRRRRRTSATTATTSAASATAHAASATIPAVELSTAPTLLAEEDRVGRRVVVGLLLARDRLDYHGHLAPRVGRGHGRELERHGGLRPGLGLVEALGRRDRLRPAGHLDRERDVGLVVLA